MKAPAIFKSLDFVFPDQVPVIFQTEAAECGRAGYAADRVLFYLTAGGAFANVQTTFNGVKTTHTQSGWTAGAGVEWAFADNWTAKVEWLYVNLGNGSVNCATTACLAASGGPVIPVSVGLTENLIRAGVNFKFSF